MPKCQCGVSAYFGHKGDIAQYCSRHKEDGMINVIDILCIDCDKRAIYNLKGEIRGIYCIDHKKNGMINVKGKRCAFTGEICYTTPIYNFDGEQKGKRYDKRNRKTM
jgi:hypothetical protein